MTNGAQLLSQYVQTGSESAFTALVNQHLNLVYSAALRETGGDTGLAEDLSQAVFTELARKARQLVGHPVLAGWLYTAVRHMAANTRRSEQRRRAREEEAQSMNELLADGSPPAAWQQLRPVLDDALHELTEEDRAALVLRFLEDRSLREVGVQLGLTENAARMRVDRALEKLRGPLARRGITSTAAGLAAALAVGVITPAPSSLAATIAAAALAGGAAAGATTLTAMKVITLTKVKLGLAAALVAAAVAVPAWQQTRLQHLRSENARLAAAQTGERTSDAALPAAPDELERARKSEADQVELAQLRQWRAQTEPELLRLRGMAGVARRANLEAEQLRAQLAKQPADTGTNPIFGAMADAMKQAMGQQVEGRLARLTAAVHLTPEQTTAAREILKRQADAMSSGMQQAFTGKFDKDALVQAGKNAGDPDTQIKALLTPEQKAAYPEYQKEEAAYNARMAANAELMQMQVSLGLTDEQLDRVFAALYQASYNQLTGALKPPATTNMAEAMEWSLDQKTKVLEPMLTPAQLDTYRQQQATQANLFKDIWSKLEASRGAGASK